MNNTTNYSDFDEGAFIVKCSQYGEWIEAARKANNLQECHERTEAVIVWLEQQKRVAPAQTCASIDSIIGQLVSAVASFPNIKKIPALPSVVADKSQLDEVTKEAGMHAVQVIESQLAKIPSELADAIRYSLAASKGLPVPGSPLEWHQVFALAFRDFGEGLAKKDAAHVSDAKTKLESWSNFTALNPGFERAELVRRVKSIIRVNIKFTLKSLIPKWLVPK